VTERWPEHEACCGVHLGGWVPDSWAEESYSVVQQISWRIGFVGAAALEAATGVHDTQLVTLGDVLRVRSATSPSMPPA
jgi:hypothetical protein